MLQLEIDYYRYNWVEIDGTTYKKPCTLVVKMKDGVQVFGKLLEVYEVNQEHLLFVQLYNTQSFDHHLHAYTVQFKQPLITEAFSHLCHIRLESCL